MSRVGQITIFLLALALSGCFAGFDSGKWSSAFLERGPQVKTGISAPLSADRLAGKWGLAAYHDNKDAERTEKAARGACSQPYVIGRGRGSTVMMHAPFATTASEMAIKSSLGATYIGPGHETDGTKDREVIRWDGKVLVTRYVDHHAYSIYGNMVLVSCGGGARA